ncbi:YlxR family protein [Aquiluna borgnonia]|uniref:YlxR family protein n=1 Tax=Aquiluna borgnonia TaxID=2499157 RepID=A0A7D4UB09_9MICO|nr:YlxR family protein [Aquiluna borgnonia]
MEPTRTCVGCRRRDSRSALFRAVSQNGLLVPDDQKSLLGRGVWFHFQCAELAISRNGFTKALGSVVITEFEAWHRQARNDAGNTMSTSK